MLGLEGKTAFVFGVASEDSIAWAICKHLAAAGVTLYLGYQKRFMSRVFKLKDELIRSTIIQIEASTDLLKEDIKENRDEIKKNSDKIYELSR